MSWVQVKSPNLNVQTSLGMCLKYVQDAFDSGWAGSYALQGWRDIVKKKHANRNIPAGVYVPIWFEGHWNGANYGHVAIYKDGVCWSSPYTNKGTHDQLGNIETVERVYGMKYNGTGYIFPEVDRYDDVVEYMEENNYPMAINCPEVPADVIEAHARTIESTSEDDDIDEEVEKWRRLFENKEENEKGASSYFVQPPCLDG